MYNIIPMMSFVMAINGPVAMAGSILNFSNVIGTSVPKIEANITTQTADGYGIGDRSRCAEPDKVVGVY